MRYYHRIFLILGREFPLLIFFYVNLHIQNAKQMKYFELTFKFTPYSEDISDVLSALLAEIGFETFMPGEDDTLKAYVQQTFYDEDNLKTTIESFPIPGIQITYSLLEPEDKDWNETWEAEGFEPICIDDRLVVCDTHHVVENYPTRILIHPRQAFGTGSHQTTRMILTELLETPLEGMSVIDAGCGTGILGFLCLLQGAGKVLAYDIDEWSVQNTLDNAKLNFENVDEKLQVRLGDAAVLQGEANYDLLIANINRNILLGDIKTFASTLKKKGSKMIMSGFYNDDIHYILEEAQQYGFTLSHERHNGEWAMVVLTS